MMRSLIETNFPDGKAHDRLDSVIDEALQRVELSFQDVVIPGYVRAGSVQFNHLHGDQSAVFLYFASWVSYAEAHDEELASKFMLLNKMRNGVVVTYSTQLPAHMLLLHTVGTMLGKAEYGDYLVVHQNVTVGTDRATRPRIGRGVVLYPGSFVLGASTVGDGVRVGARAVVKNENVPPNCVVGGTSPHLEIHPSTKSSLAGYFEMGSGSR